MTKVGENAFLDNLSSMHGLRRNLLSRFFEIGYGDIEFARSLARGLEKNVTVGEIYGMCHLSHVERFDLELNRHGRYLLCRDDIPVAL